MRVLILGGTQFIGRHIVETLFAAGHRVTILTRGKTADHLPADIERLRGDRNEGSAGYKSLENRDWDACVDVCGYTAKQVRPVAEQLREHVKRYVFISTMSVYADSPEHPIRETHPLCPPAGEDVTTVHGETYGPLKVACENIIQQIYGDRCTILRPQIVAGPYDHTGRYSYWLEQAMAGKPIMAPGNGSDYLQVIDARDLAGFALKVIENDIAGSFNLAGPRMTWSKFLRVLGAENVEWLPAETILKKGVKNLPLYIPDGGPWSGLMNVSSEKAEAAGLKLSDLETTAQATREWISAGIGQIR